MRAWMDGAIRTPDKSPMATQRPLSGRSSPSSISMDSVSSTKSGLPSAASWMRDATTGSSVASPNRFSISSSDRSGDRGSRVTVIEPACAVQPGRSSSNSWRAIARSTSGALCDRSTTYSTRSSSVGSAQWRSSSTTTRGRFRASVSNSLRTPQKPSSAAAPASTNPISSATRSAARALNPRPQRRGDLPGRDSRVVVVGNPHCLAHDFEDGPEGDAFAVRETASRQHRRARVDLLKGLRRQP